jgi:carbon monoxide dehydrogenase subunit G
VAVFEASAVLHAPREEVFAFIQDFSGTYPRAEYLDGVHRRGDGGFDTEYAIAVSWWRLSYVSRSRVVDVEAPVRMEWRTTDRVDATGEWRLEDHDEGTELFLRVEFDPGPLERALPSALPLGALRERLAGPARREARRILAAVAEDLESEPREVPVTVHRLPDVL